MVFSDGFALGPQAQSFFPGDFADGVQTPPPPANMKYHFGRTLATGDYQGDGFADLFIGVPSLSLDRTMGWEAWRSGLARPAWASGRATCYSRKIRRNPARRGRLLETSFAFTTGLSGTSVTWIGEQMGHALSR